MLTREAPDAVNNAIARWLQMPATDSTPANLQGEATS
jgi:hypothetical protein